MPLPLDVSITRITLHRSAGEFSEKQVSPTGKVRIENGPDLEYAAGDLCGNLVGAMSSVPSRQEYLDAQSHRLDRHPLCRVLLARGNARSLRNSLCPARWGCYQQRLPLGGRDCSRPDP